MNNYTQKRVTLQVNVSLPTSETATNTARFAAVNSTFNDRKKRDTHEIDRRTLL